jgi:holo-[acyl-carrier protein] synthase
MKNIFGLGTDVVNLKRFKSIIKKNNSFKKRIFSKSEIDHCEKKNDNASFYAKRFAAKEAFSKAIGTGFRDNLNFKDITIINDKLGKPSFIVSDKIKKIVKKQFKISSFNFFLSISDEKKYSIAYVILQKK